MRNLGLGLIINRGLAVALDPTTLDLGAPRLL
eukprot:SAG11_NODE_30044_length_304_cov_4.019512_1_plen_31_part_10